MHSIFYIFLSINIYIMNFTRPVTNQPYNQKSYNSYGGIGAKPAATARALSKRTAGSQGSPMFVQKNTGKPTQKDDDDFKALSKP